MNEQEMQEAEKLRQHNELQRIASEESRVSWRRFYLKMAGYVALPLAFIALIPSVVAFYLIDQKVDVDSLIFHEHEHIQYDLCTGLQEIKKSNRVQAQMSYDNLDLTLRLLGIPPTQEVEEIAKAQLEATLARNAPIVGSCVLPLGGNHD